MFMKAVGLRELKNRLSEYIRLVRGGEAILVTDRGEVVAELTPPGHASPDQTVPPGLMALAKRGRIRLGRRNDPAMYPALPRALPEGRAGEFLDEERGSR